jgi:hypothetical protein
LAYSGNNPQNNETLETNNDFFCKQLRSRRFLDHRFNQPACLRNRSCKPNALRLIASQPDKHPFKGISK